MNNLKTVVAIAVGSLFAGAAFAQSNYSIEQRDRIEQQRIDRGVQSGQLTSREADRLQGERAQIERMENRARSDGVMTRNERARIDGAQDRLSRDIRRESNDRQTSSGYGRQGDNRGNGWGRGNERGYENGARGGHNGFENGSRGERGDSRSTGWTQHASNSTGTSTGTGNSHGWTQHAGNGTGTTTTGAGTGTTTGTGNSHGSTPRTGTTTHASMPQAQVRSTQTQASRQVSMASQGGNSGRRTR